MRKLLLLLVLPLTIYGQNLSLSDILYGKTHKVHETQDLLIKRGFHFVDAQPGTWLPQTTVFAFGAHNIQYQILIGNSNSVVLQIEVIMESSKHWSAIKLLAKQSGYTVNTIDSNDPLESEYIKEPNHISFTSDKNETVGVFYKITYTTSK